MDSWEMHAFVNIEGEKDIKQTCYLNALKQQRRVNKLAMVPGWLSTQWGEGESDCLGICTLM